MVHHESDAMLEIGCYLSHNLIFSSFWVFRLFEDHVVAVGFRLDGSFFDLPGITSIRIRVEFHVLGNHDIPFTHLLVFALPPVLFQTTDNPDTTPLTQKLSATVRKCSPRIDVYIGNMSVLWFE